MTLEEKFELLKAYKEGKRVEVYDTMSNKWCEKIHDIWDFKYGQYRIKSTHTFKFKVNDNLVYRGDANTPSPTIYTVMNVDNNGYTLNMGEFEKSPSIIEKEYISERDVLWYFEIYDYVTKTWKLLTYRRFTISEADSEFGVQHDTLSWKPMYNLGFKLKEITNV